VILMTGFGSLETAIEGVRAGAFDYIGKPFDVRALLALVERGLAAGGSAPALQPAEPPLPVGITGRTPGMVELYKQIALAADTRIPVLIVGETGTGKELVARAIHDHARGGSGPFEPFNCAAVPETLLASELFGHVRGAFTDAVTDKKGLFELANGGTIFLDEIAETTPGLQVSLLRVLQEGEVRPVGGSRTTRVTARVLAATNRDPEREVAEKRFREDLYYRLSAFIIQIPPLRDRREDIPLLAEAFLRNACTRARKEVALAPGAEAALKAHSWPGNVRQLENAMERLVISARVDQLQEEDVLDLLHRQRLPRSDPAFEGLPTLDQLEQRYIKHVLEVAEGNRTRAAEILGIDRRSLYRKASRYGFPLGSSVDEESGGA
jgi:DNA-binding NtrC family response regulator